MTSSTYGAATLPKGIRSRMIYGVNGLDIHILEAGYEESGRPLIVLLHGFPDLAYGWRHVLPILAASGYHVVAPDQRGYGRTSGWPNSYDTSLAPFRLLNMATDIIELVATLGYRHTAMLVGHDIGSPVAAYCALIRPDLFASLVLMSAPFPGPPAPASNSENKVSAAQPTKAHKTLSEALAALHPPKQHYQQYLSSRAANMDMWHPPQGLQAFLRAFFHVKSGDWSGNNPHPLTGQTAEELANLPAYYVMDLGKAMSETVAPFHPSAAVVQSCEWLTESELGVYVEEFSRTGFQGALQIYRVLADPDLNAELSHFSGKTIDLPSLFIGAEHDWGTYAAPGALELMKTKATTQMKNVAMIDGAGHWIQQEQPHQLGQLLLSFLKENRTAPLALGTPENGSTV
ncbi:alpha/beta fold hydrolase [Mangrovitalea sediminis]|uniref:alpha/beta fold hydrolase n=1 Tax=Mangrovitalea sediminis TaxID=1982043 RepID=UPI0018E91B5C|nr:alpha/beta hydrolase [Mangrovitalea sediminis]